MFYRSDVCEDISSEFLTVQQYVIFHGYSYRVRIQIVFIHYGGIISVQVIDRNVRTCSQGIIDQTGVRIRQFQVIICGCKCS